MAPLILPDQHDEPHPLVEKTGIILFAPDHASSAIAHQLLVQAKPDAVTRLGIRYVADISGMPSLIARLFALPKMRGYPYRMLLGHAAEDTALLPRREGRVTVLHVRDWKIERIEFADSLTALRAAVGLRTD